MTPSHDLTVRKLPISELRPHPENARRGDVGRIAGSLLMLGQYRPIVVNVGTQTGRPNEILAGHHLVLAAQALEGWESVDCTMVDVDDDTAKRIMLIDNRSSDLATYDDRLLAELLESLPDLDATGYEPGDLEALKAFLESGVGDIGGNDQDILDNSDASAWPEVRAKIAPELHAKWMNIPGDDDAERIACVLSEVP